MILELIFMIENFTFKQGCSNIEKSVKMRSKQQAYTHVVKSSEAKHFPVVESKAMVGKLYWYVCHDVTGSNLH